MWLGVIVGLAVGGEVEMTSPEVSMSVFGAPAELHPVTLGTLQGWPAVIVVDPSLTTHQVGRDWVELLELRERRGRARIERVEVGEAALVGLDADVVPGHELRVAPRALPGWSWRVSGDQIWLEVGDFDSASLVGAAPSESVFLALVRELQIPVDNWRLEHPLPVDSDRPARMDFQAVTVAESDPLSALVYGWQAQALWQAGEAQRALQVARDASRADPGSCEATRRLALWRMRDAGRLAGEGLAGTLVRRSLSEAVEGSCLHGEWTALADAAFSGQEVQDPSTPLAVGLSRWRLGDLHLSTQHLVQAANGPLGREASLALAVIYGQRGEEKAAAAWLQRAQKGDPFPMLTAWVASQVGLGPQLAPPTHAGPPHLDPEAWLTGLGDSDAGSAVVAWEELLYRWPELAVPRPRMEGVRGPAVSENEE